MQRAPCVFAVCPQIAKSATVHCVLSYILFQEANASTYVPTRCVCQSLLCVMVSSTAKTAVMNSTVPEHVSS